MDPTGSGAQSGMDPAQAGAMVAQLTGYLPIYFSVAKTIESTRTFTAVMTGIVVFNHIATLPSEVKYIWRQKLSWLNACILINRYGIVVELAIILYLFYWPSGSFEDCKKIYLYEAYMPMAVSVFSNIILISRVYALWEKSRIILAIMVGLLLFQVAIQIWVPIKSDPMVLPTGISDLSIPDIRACIPGTSTSKYWLYFTVAVIFDAFAFILSVIPCLRIWREGKQSEIFRTLFRDGIAFFAMCLAANLANIIYFALSGSNDNKAYLAPMAAGVQAIAAHRMVINLRTANDQSRVYTSSAAAIPSVSTSFSGKTGFAKVTDPHRRSANNVRNSYPSPRLATPHFPDGLDQSEKGEVIEMKGRAEDESDSPTRR